MKLHVNVGVSVDQTEQLSSTPSDLVVVWLCGVVMKCSILVDPTVDVQL